MNDDDLIEAFRAAPPRETGEPPVPPARTWAALQGELPPGEAAALVDRVARDPAFASEWRIALAFSREEATNAGTAARATPAVPWRWVVAATAAAIALTWAVTASPPTPTSHSEAVRGADTGPIEPAVPGGVIAETSAVLRWTPLVDATYRVFVADEDLTVLVDGTSTAVPSFELDDEVLARRSGNTILWRVEATLTSGTTILSRTFTARVKPQ